MFFLDSYNPNSFKLKLIGGRERINQSSLNNRKKLLFNLKRLCTVNVIKYPLNKDFKIYGNLNSFYLSDITISSLHNSIVVIDIFSHTFIFKAIYQEIPFVLFFSRDWLQYFTKRYINFLKILEDENLLFYWNQEIEFLSFLKNQYKKLKQFLENSNNHKY